MDDTKKSNATLVLAILLGMSGLLNICLYGKLHQEEVHETIDDLMAQRFIHIQDKTGKWSYIPTREIALITSDGEPVVEGK